MATQIFINLPVEDLKKSMDFFSAIGFTFNKQFTDDNAACMIISENIFAMLLVKKFFQTFTKKRIADTKETIEVLNAVSVGSKREVDEIVTKAVAAGGREPREPQDHGWMYSRAFEDLDNHTWEVFYADERKMPAEMKERGK